jgi:hypothetical protein
MIDPFREGLESVQQTTAGLAMAAEGLTMANEGLTKAVEGVKRTAQAMLAARDEHTDLRETVERLERLVMELLQRTPPPPPH